MTTWRSAAEPDHAPIPMSAWPRVLWRGVSLSVVTFGCLALLLIVRLIERPLFGARRPWTPFITQFVCRSAFVLLGIKRETRGKPLNGGGAVVANHSSWIDIFTLNAGQRIYFVSKAEVAGWPAIGWLARATGTVFISRQSWDAQSQKSIFEARLSHGHELLFFPEGTSTDGSTVLPFKTTLFEAFFTANLQKSTVIQPLAVKYFSPFGEDDNFYGWWGDMGFGPHLLKVLAAPRQGKVVVSYLEPLRVSDFQSRKDLAKGLENSVRQGFDALMDEVHPPKISPKR